MALQNPQELHSLSSHAEVAAAALGSVYAANRLIKAVDENPKDEAGHSVKALVSAAVAIGAYEQMKKKALKQCPVHKHCNGCPACKSGPPEHHTRHMVEEMAGAYALYALGKELLSNHRHHTTHLVMEALGATGLVKDISAYNQPRS
jgi:hypothetical protein